MTERNRGNAGKGRKPGVPNKTTAALKDAIMQAFHAEGGVEWLRSLSRTEPRAFAMLLGKVLPLQIAGHDGGALVVRWESGKDG